MLDNGFIRTDMKYIVGKKSFGYRLNRHTSYHASVKKIPINNRILCKHKLSEIVEKEKKITETKRFYSNLTQWFDGLEIDKEGAINRIEQPYPEQKGGIRGTRKGKASDWEKRYRSIQAIEKLANKEFYYNVDENVGRFHSNLTNLKKELRNFITYNGQKLVNIDIKNAQPLFSTLLFCKEFYNENSLKINIFNYPSIINLIASNHQYFISYTIILVKMLDSVDKQDINAYCDFVYSGNFYQKISEVLYPTATFEKQNVKKMMFVIFFSNNRYMGQSGAKSKKDFKAHFPQTYEIFRRIKLKNHSALAHLLQRIESSIMIENVAARISEERPDLPIFTIHDSVVTILGNEEYVSTVIKEEIFRLTGLNAQLGIEFWAG